MAALDMQVTADREDLSAGGAISCGLVSKSKMSTDAGRLELRSADLALQQ
jgi:hypothetical protein